jgi:transcriptional regulator with XRE-family HTH domain
MKVKISSPTDLGLVVRAMRRDSKVRIDDFAGLAGVSKQFASDLEHGKPTLQIGLALKVLQDLGVEVSVEIPSSAHTHLETLQAQGGLKPLKPRAIRKQQA